MEFQFHDGIMVARNFMRGKQNIVPIVLISEHVRQRVIDKLQ